MNRKVVVPLTLLLIIVPRLARFCYERVWIEDPNYLYAAYLLTLGDKPFVDFAQPNLPVLEYFLAGLYRIFGPSYQVAELLTALTVALTAGLLAFIGFRLWGSAAGLIAALAYSSHPLIFRYHLCDREVFTTLFLTVATASVLLLPHSPNLSAVIVALALIAGFTMKQTMLIPAAALGLYLLTTRRFRELITIVLLTLIGLSAIGLFFYARYSSEFIHQIYTFHLIKGKAAATIVKVTWFAQSLNYLIPVGLWGIWRLAAARKHETILFSAIIGLEFLFDCFVSATLWPHYMIPVLVPLSLGIGFAVHCVILERRTARFKLQAVVGGCAALVLGALWFYVIVAKTEQSLAETWGFAGTKRITLSKLGAAVQRLTPDSGVIISPPLEGLVCQRKKLVNFKDNLGVMLALRRALAADAFDAFKQRTATQTFADIRRDSCVEWLPWVVSGIKDKRIAAVIPNYELPVDSQFYTNSGYYLAYSDPPYEVWIPRPEDRHE